ncbi:hypothetical protein LXJ58_35200, partial [Escherichia coli]|nr:hypothetical protein [Escherichia coli]
PCRSDGSAESLSERTVRRQNIRHNSRRKLAEWGPRLGLMLGGALAVKQAPMLDGLSFDPFALLYDGGSPSEVGVGACNHSGVCSQTA